MAKKKSTRKKTTSKKTTRKRTTKKRTRTSAALTIQRGGEEFQVEKSEDAFAVKRKSMESGADFIAATRNPELFATLKLDAERSTKNVELYHVKSSMLEKTMEALRTDSPDVAWCSHVYHMPGDDDGLMTPGDDIYVELKPNFNEAKINELLDEHALEFIPEDEDSPNIFRVRLTSASKENPIKIANALRKSSGVVLAEPNFAISGSIHIHRPSDDLFPSQWHLENRGGVGLTRGVDVSAPQAWDITRGSRDLTVAVIDDGFDIGHPDFSSHNKIRAGRDFGQGDTNPSPVSSIDNHGTACAGVAVADENGSGVVGLAPECGLMPIRWSSSISDTDIKEQFDHARLNGADVISCSWGVASQFFTLSTSMKRSITKAATQGRNGKGCVILFAAGNDNRDIDDPPRTRDGFAIHPDVIAVAASNSHDKKSDYSNFGDAIWVCAPSSGAGGRRIVTTDRRGSQGYQSGDYTTVRGFGGTSSSTPLVAGLCGLILAVNPDLTAAEVKNILKETAVKIDPSGGNYDSNGHSRKYGWGRVDAFAAVQRAQGSTTPGPGIRVVSFERRPDLRIPDNNPAGINDSIQVNEAGTVQSVQVDVRITHTYRGDLKLSLVAPDGTTVPLFGRSTPTNDTRDDLITTFTSGNAPALSQLQGKSVPGSWTLQVADLAPADFGTLDEWVLRIGMEPTQSEWEATPGVRIPDNNATGITSDIDVDQGGALKNITVDVDISHSYRGDLRVVVESPSGTSASLKSVNSQDGDNNLKQTYRLTDTPALQAFLNEDIRGRWRLHVSDNLSADEGKLNRWSIKLQV